MARGRYIMSSCAPGPLDDEAYHVSTPYTAIIYIRQNPTPTLQARYMRALCL